MPTTPRPYYLDAVALSDDDSEAGFYFEVFD